MHVICKYYNSKLLNNFYKLTYYELLNKLSGDVLNVRLVAIQATVTLKAVTPTTLAKLVCQVHFHRFSKNHQAIPYDIIRLTPTPKMPA